MTELLFSCVDLQGVQEQLSQRYALVKRLAAGFVPQLGRDVPEDVVSRRELFAEHAPGNPHNVDLLPAGSQGFDFRRDVGKVFPAKQDAAEGTADILGRAAGFAFFHDLRLTIQDRLSASVIVRRSELATVEKDLGLVPSVRIALRAIFNSVTVDLFDLPVPGIFAIAMILLFVGGRTLDAILSVFGLLSEFGNHFVSPFLFDIVDREPTFTSATFACLLISVLPCQLMVSYYLIIKMSRVHRQPISAAMELQ